MRNISKASKGERWYWHSLKQYHWVHYACLLWYLHSIIKKEAHALYKIQGIHIIQYYSLMTWHFAKGTQKRRVEWIFIYSFVHRFIANLKFVLKEDERISLCRLTADWLTDWRKTCYTILLVSSHHLLSCLTFQITCFHLSPHLSSFITFFHCFHWCWCSSNTYQINTIAMTTRIR